MRERFKYIRPISIFTFAILITGLVLLYAQHKASADSYTWTSGSLTGERRDDITYSSHGIDYGTCTNQKVTYSTYVFVQNPTADACVFTAKSFRYAIFNTDWVSGLFVSIGTDKKMYHVDNVGFTSRNNVRPSPNTDDFIFSQSVWKDLPSKLTLVQGPSGQSSYNPTEFSRLSARDELGDDHETYFNTVSHNGQWEVINVANLGYVRINLQDFTAKWIAPFQSQYETAAISNDGRFVSVTSYNTGPRPPTIYDLDNCGQSAPVVQSTWFGATSSNLCAGRDLSDVINNTLGTNYNTFGGTVPDFSDDGWQLSLFTYPNGIGSPGKALELRAAGYMPLHLDYLALGDSYSSGEGDTEADQYGKKHYRAYTNNEENQAQGVPREKCHISTRSYPYKLAQSMGLALDSPKQWDTVACSGAQVYDLNELDAGTYLGQGKGGGEGGKPRLQGYANALALKDTALNEFIPGRQKQIEFVKKYKPKVITLTMGGNDAGFEPVINACVNPSPLGGGEWTTTCSYGKDDDKKSYLAGEIKKQYTKLKTLYLKLYEASDYRVKIYVLGYPQFVNSGPSNLACGLNVRLNNDEREMVQEAVNYMNSVIKAAADAAGVKYIDVSHSFDGHQLCDDGIKYITGISGMGNWLRDEQQESFHPTPNGHSAFANALLEQLNGQTPLDYDICPETPIDDTICPKDSPEPLMSPYFQNAVTSADNPNYLNMVTKIVKGALNAISTPIYILDPNSPVQILIYSDPIDLGTHSVNSQGALQANISIPSNLSPGYHTLVVIGKSYSGEPIALWQIVEVQGSNPNDIDEDGITDTSDHCIYISPANVDSDLDGIDDACDPYIDPTPRPDYRLRAGDSQRTYQGAAEHTGYLYLERNIYATSITGISGDDDPDGDGYTVIAASQFGMQNGRYANLQIDIGSIPNTLSVSFRTAENGCTQYRPTDLSRVTSSSSYRTFTQQAINTNTCRSQPPVDDLDNNSQPDNMQPLYIGRNGDPSKGEVATKLYLLRSTRGAESQLGISDYAPLLNTAPSTIPVDDSTDYRQSWSLLASTQSNPLLAVTYKTIRMVGTVPYVVVKTNLGGLCQAYKPANIATIKQSTQNTINLTLDLQQTLNAQLGGWCNG